MNIISIIQAGVSGAIRQLYGESVDPDRVSVTATRKEFTGDFTVVVFPYTKFARKKPHEIGQEIGDFLIAQQSELASFNVIQGFVNLSVSPVYWHTFLMGMYADTAFGRRPRLGKKVMVEFCSPNTNKPIHLGHIRNILLGWSTASILDAMGYDVVKVQVINDRGIAICKSMLAWQLFAAGEEPAAAGKKPDHFVGDYYVAFEKAFQTEYKAWQLAATARTLLSEELKEGESEADFFKRYKDTYFNRQSELGAAAREMLRRWEEGDSETVALWKKMNGWVYEGFNETFDKLQIHFDKLYFESNTYLLGKDMTDEGLASGIFYRKDDGSVWADLTEAKLDQKAILRSDGTSLYITQDMGTARLRYQDFGVEKMVYVVADEQNYHFQVLFEILKRMGEPYAAGLYHLAYGMVELPSGKMKSREGTVVDADDLIAEVIEEARSNSQERDTTAELTQGERDEIIRRIGMAALKFFILKVHPQKRMVFDPKESVDLHGQTGPYVQNAYVRIRSVLRKAQGATFAKAGAYEALTPDECDLIRQLYSYPSVLEEAAITYDPSTLATYAYTLAKSFHKFYHDYSILNAESEETRDFRLALSQAIAHVLLSSMQLLGIEMPERM
jgi:arginyl-tRNA synthetase